MEKYNELGYYNGTYGELSEIMIPMNDRASFFGDGVYDATIARNGVIHDLDKHIDRIYRSASLLQIKISMSKDEMRDILNNLITKVSFETTMVYFQVTRGTAKRNHAFPDVPSNFWVTLTDYGTRDPFQSIDVITYPDKRFEYCNIKTLNLIPSVLASQAAKEANVQESIFLRPGNIVTECAHSNISIIKDGKFITHPADEFILPGIGRQNLIDKCQELYIPVIERTYTLDELLDADEIIVSASGTFCIGVNHVDGKPVGGKNPDILRLLQEELWKDYLAEIGLR